MRTYISILFVALLSLSCDQGTPTQDSTPISNTGSVSFSLSKLAIPPGVNLLAVRLERPGVRPISDSVFVSGTGDTIKIRMDNVPVGSWNVTVEARDIHGTTRYSGKGSVTVFEGQIAQLYIYMTPVSGGGIQIWVIWASPRFHWNMSAENPVIRQTVGSWDQNHYYFDDPSILKINGVYHAWYSSGTNISISKVETLWIAHAYSLDGIHWTKTGPVIGPGVLGSWRDKGAISPCVLYEGGTFRMWFVGTKNPFQYQNGIGYATSQDGLTWVISPQPVIPLSPTVGATWHPSVVKKNQLYHLFLGVSTSPTVYSGDVLFMTSLDGTVWQNQGVVLSARRDLSWQHSGIFPSEVIYDESRFKMFFTAIDGQSLSIGYAESYDGIVWKGSTEPPILTFANTLPWVTASVGFPAVLRDEGKLKMWFSAILPSPPRYQIGYAEQVQ